MKFLGDFIEFSFTETGIQINQCSSMRSFKLKKKIEKGVKTLFCFLSSFQIFHGNFVTELPNCRIRFSIVAYHFLAFEFGKFFILIRNSIQYSLNCKYNE